MSAPGVTRNFQIDAFQNKQIQKISRFSLRWRLINPQKRAYHPTSTLSSECGAATISSSV